jgi:hypothetical protein
MPEKLMQAAIITFLLYLIAGLSPHARMPIRTSSSVQEAPTPNTLVSLLLRPFHR